MGVWVLGLRVEGSGLRDSLAPPAFGLGSACPTVKTFAYEANSASLVFGIWYSVFKVVFRVLY